MKPSAAIDFVETSIQHAAYIAGRRDTTNEAAKATQLKNLGITEHVLKQYIH